MRKLMLGLLLAAAASPVLAQGRVPDPYEIPHRFVQTSPQGYDLGQAYSLARNVSTAGAQAAAPGIPKDSYFFTCSATNWNSASAQLQYLGPDGTTYFNFSNAAETANPGATGGGPIGVGIGANSTVRVLVTGTPTGLYCSLT